MPLTPEEKREKKREQNKKYHEKNREKIAEKRRKKYREENREKIAEREREIAKNREKIAERKRERNKKSYHKNKEKNREKKRERDNKFYDKNKEEISEKQKKYNQTKSGKHRGWKKNGIKILEDTYEKFEECKNCELCNVELTTKGKTRKVLDHDHDSGYARFVCCNNCNMKLGVRDRMMDRVHKELWRYHNRKYRND